MTIKKRLIIYLTSLFFICGAIIAGAARVIFPLYTALRQSAAISGALQNIFIIFIIAGALILLCALICACAMAALMARGVLPPLKTLSRLASEIREGNLDCRMEYSRGDEFEQVFREFDAMRERLKISLAETAALEENRRMLAASLAHDIKTPVTSICAYAEGLSDGIASTPEARKRYAETILQKARLVDSLIGDLFLFSKLELNQASLTLQEVNASVFLSDAFAEAAKNASFALTYTCSGDLENETLLAHPTAFARVIQNITQNSVRHAGADNLAIRVTARRHENSVNIKITDNGAGISEEECERIFERFYRADPARGGSGSGLGLSICRRLIQGMNGKIWARGQKGEGLGIYISLPLKNKKE